MIKILGISIGILVSIINYLLVLMERKIANYQCHKTKTEHNISMASRLALT